MNTSAVRVISLIGVLGMLFLAACGSEDSTPPTATPAPELTSIPENGTVSPVLIHLQQEYETLSAAYEAMTTIWEALATGGTAQCGDYPDLVPPGSISADDDPSLAPLADALHQAAVELDTSLTLWQNECTKPRTNPAPDVIQSGRLATRSAGDSLGTAALLLGGVQPPATN